MGTVFRVLRTEGAFSAYRRAEERVAESLHRFSLLARPARPTALPILNVSPMGVAPRRGGVPTQLLFRLGEERALRSVALYSPGFLELPSGARRVSSVQEALALTGAKTIHLEGTFGARLADLQGVELIVSVHELGAPRELLEAARVIVYPSRFLRDRYGMEGEIIEPGVPAPHPASGRLLPAAGREGLGVRGIAFAGAVQRHKGAHLLPELAELTPELEWHAFGGGELPLPRSVNRHGYYRAGSLPSLLARHHIGRVVIPSIVEESFSLVLSECWQAGVPVIAFDHGAIGQRIREHGGGWLAPAGSGAAGLAHLIRQNGGTRVPRNVPTAADAAKAYLALYRRCTMHGIQ
ncbi:MAG TPA: glycosyltransferase [Thermoanaerobaculia bacterium]|nr:glycosyltransferase [Thermoanaerobaculia bacterium]